jgi:hypothetical protein
VKAYSILHSRSLRFVIFFKPSWILRRPSRMPCKRNYWSGHDISLCLLQTSSCASGIQRTNRGRLHAVLEVRQTQSPDNVRHVQIQPKQNIILVHRLSCENECIRLVTNLKYLEVHAIRIKRAAHEYSSVHTTVQHRATSHLLFLWIL